MTVYTHDLFTALVDRTFVISAITTADHGVEYDVTAPDKLVLTLKAVTTFPAQDYPGRVREVFFTLRFSSELDLPQGTYRLLNDTLGETEIFLMPRPPSQTEYFMDAIFN